MKSVSVIIPTHNRATYVCEAIDSILHQDITDCHIEIIVVDDGSTDNTREAVATYGNRVTYLYQPCQGPGSARNRGIEASSGEWITFLDSDDLWLPYKLSLQFRVLEAFPGYHAIHSNFYTTENGDVTIPKGLDFWLSLKEDRPFDWSSIYESQYDSFDKGISLDGKSLKIYGGNIFNALLHHSCVSCVTLLIKRDCLIDSVRFHPTSIRWQDYWFACKLCEYQNILFIDYPTVENRGHTGSRLTQGHFEKGLECFLEICHDIYMPSRCSKRPSQIEITEVIRNTRKDLLKAYIAINDRKKARQLLLISKDEFGISCDRLTWLYKLLAMVPFNIFKYLLCLKRFIRFSLRHFTSGLNQSR